MTEGRYPATSLQTIESGLSQPRLVAQSTAAVGAQRERAREASEHSLTVAADSAMTQTDQPSSRWEVAFGDDDVGGFQLTNPCFH